MNIAIIGSGGREHALSWKLAQSPQQTQIFTLPGNGGIPNSIPMDIADFAAIEQFCKKEQIDLLVVGPEVPLSNGIVNYFEDSPVNVFGPDKRAATLEGSKIYAKLFMEKYGVATADFKAFNKIEDAHEYIAEKKGDCVIKFDGLAAGKGVYVCNNIAEAETALNELKGQYGNELSFLIEDKLLGDEISIIGITDGKSIKLLQASQDHKQLLDGDLGPNTGGMGAYTPVSFCDEKMMETIYETAINPTIKGLQEEHFNYKGFLYFGLMITDTGPKVLEYNCRLGDPETEVILPSLDNDLLPILLSCFDGTLATQKMVFKKGYFVDIVQVSGGYPKKYEKGFPIVGLSDLSDSTLAFHAGTKKEEDQILTNGGRVLNIVVQGDTLEDAITKAYSECKKVGFKDHYYRKDIGKRKG